MSLDLVISQFLALENSKEIWLGFTVSTGREIATPLMEIEIIGNVLKIGHEYYPFSSIFKMSEGRHMSYGALTA